MGVIINRYGSGYERIEYFCDTAGVPVLMVIPFERAIAGGVARGKTLVEIRPDYIEHFQQMFSSIAACIGSTHYDTIERIRVHT